MRTIAVLLLLILAGRALAAECVGYSQIELAGALRSETFPSPPEYESVAKGDKPERYFFIVPAASLCVSQGDESGLEPAAIAVHRVQLMFNDPSAYGTLRPLLGKEVRCTGKLIGAHTGHHHSEVLLTSAKCDALQPIAPADGFADR
jgi:hypothetical protein